MSNEWSLELVLLGLLLCCLTLFGIYVEEKKLYAYKMYNMQL